MDKCYIDYLNKENNFRETRKTFKNYNLAEKWGRKNLSNFHIDMIKYY
jgi:hypothetical protein